MSAPTFIENSGHANAVASLLGEGAQEHPQTGSARLHAQVAFKDDYQQKTSKLLDRENPEGRRGVPTSRNISCTSHKTRATRFDNAIQSSSENQPEVSVVLQ